MHLPSWQRVARVASWQVLGKLLSTVFGFVATLLLLRFLGAERTGWYTIAAGYLQFFGIASDAGFILVTNVMLSEARFAADKIFDTLFTWRLVSAVTTQAVACAIFFILGYRSEISWAVVILSISFLAAQINQVLWGYYQARVESHIPIIAETIGRAALVIGLLLLRPFPQAFIPFMTVITLAALINTSILLFRHGTIKLRVDRDVSRAMWHKMWPTAVSVMCNAVYLQGDKIILPRFEPSTVVVGWYGAAYRIIDIVTQLGAMLMGTFLPLLTRTFNDRAAFTKHLHFAITGMALLLFPALGGLVMLAEPIARFVGPEFAGAAPLIRLLAFTIGGIWLGMIFGHVALSGGRQKEAMGIFALVGLVGLIGYLLFIPSYHANGAAGVSIATEWLAGLGLLAVCARYMPISLPFATLSKIIFATFIMCLALAYARQLPLYVSLAGGIVVYAGVTVALRIVPWTTLKTFFSPTAFTLTKSPLAGSGEERDV